MRYPTHHNEEKFVKKFFKEMDVEVMLQRLDRLTQNEARTTAAQTLEVIYGLMQNMRAVMDGEKTIDSCSSCAGEHSYLFT